jgi:hypothetical protein
MDFTKEDLYNLFRESRLYFVNGSGNVTRVFARQGENIFCITERGTFYNSRLSTLRNSLNNETYKLIRTDNVCPESLLSIQELLWTREKDAANLFKLYGKEDVLLDDSYSSMFSSNDNISIRLNINIYKDQGMKPIRVLINEEDDYCECCDNKLLLI